MTDLLVTVAIIVVIALVIRVVTRGIKWVLRFVCNAVLGVALLYLLNFIPQISIPITLWRVALTGIFGLPAVLVFFVIIVLL